MSTITDTSVESTRVSRTHQVVYWETSRGYGGILCEDYDGGKAVIPCLQVFDSYDSAEALIDGVKALFRSMEPVRLAAPVKEVPGP